MMQGELGWRFGWLLFPLMMWSMVWTGLALWHAARREEKGWFIFFLLVHTAGIVELIYLFFVAKCCGPQKSTKTKRRS
ncbi:hypothetical protein A2Z00_03825 [Candidatus Gottesmanbacteria bacterium RBG_13_45_10]|uniref:DUF5652 domain-containing protein n=1 Tax=Candidatus Gottesmanbacteria bacterium RBG_13_45_10 TaxID=1798370 RepID=A0A1F5ZH37_9BACT|nr:MAG: hypothetical protein A2Z00_03825 [Candidatus Gottesmanbacteria bacterium RBG_13_45_10]